jgi:hypothetical protein
LVGSREILAAAKTRVVSTAVRTTATLGPPATKKRKPEYQGKPTTIGSTELTTEGSPAVDHNNRLDLKKGQQ